jgi:hypothetical protein
MRLSWHRSLAVLPRRCRCGTAGPLTSGLGHVAPAPAALVKERRAPAPLRDGGLSGGRRQWIGPTPRDDDLAGAELGREPWPAVRHMRQNPVNGGRSTPRGAGAP